LHTSSFFTGEGGSVKINGIPHGALNDSNVYYTTGSEIVVSFKSSPGNISYQANWEQVYATSSEAQMTVAYTTIQPEYSIATRNGSANKLIHTNQTVSMNGKIFIT
jgi:hypothetical protein